MKIERFDEIYLRYYRLSLKVAYSVVHDVELAQDICQEVFITMFFKLDEIDEEFAKAWILSYSRRIAVDFCRKSYHKHEVISGLDANENGSGIWTGDPEDLVVRKELCRKKLRVFYSLKQRNEVWYELIRRVSVNEENPVSVASDYGISVAYLRMQISRARHWMAEELRRQGND